MRNKHLYPANWKEISLSIRAASQWRCEECDRPCRRPRENWHDFVDRLAIGDSQWQPATSDEVYDDETGEWGYVAKPTRFTLTVAHLDHDPSRCDRANLKALCAPCHLRYDSKMHAAKAAKTRSRKRESAEKAKGQLSLF
jgi:hypothetical protein